MTKYTLTERLDLHRKMLIENGLGNTAFATLIQPGEFVDTTESLLEETSNDLRRLRRTAIVLGIILWVIGVVIAIVH